MTIDHAARKIAADLPDRCRSACFACGVRNDDGLALRFTEESEDTVVGASTRDENS